MHNRQDSVSKNVSTKKEDNFICKLCEAMVSASIPWHASNNEKLKSVLFKYTKINVPKESTLRKSYLKKCYDQALDHIREDIGDYFIWVSVDETTDATGRYIANLVVGNLSEDRPSNPYLILCQEITETTNKLKSFLTL